MFLTIFTAFAIGLPAQTFWQGKNYAKLKN